MDMSRATPATQLSSILRLFIPLSVSAPNLTWSDHTSSGRTQNLAVSGVRAETVLQVEKGDRHLY